jgi:hypothetical protein
MAEKFPYEDIIGLSRPISKKYPQPSLEERAARFAPFAAITGYEDMVLEEARVTEARIHLDENALTLLNKKLNLILEFLDKTPEITITYFEPDKKKAGGSYVSITGIVKRIDQHKRFVIMNNDKKIHIDDIFKLSGDLFHTFGLDD